MFVIKSQDRLSLKNQMCSTFKKMYLDTEEKSIDEDSKYQTTEESTAETEEIEDSQISES